MSGVCLTCRKPIYEEDALARWRASPPRPCPLSPICCRYRFCVIQCRMSNSTSASFRLLWAIFTAGLVASLAVFGFRADWASQSWLDVSAFIVSVISAFGVLLYVTRRAHLPAFWGIFRWLFSGVVIAQIVVHGLYGAGQRGFTGLGSVAFIVALSIAFGWVYFIQWVAMSRLSRRR